MTTNRPTNKRRNISGILLLDKPLGLTSNEALQKIKFIYQAKKAGHTGSLDPLASGMLPICFGDATKFTQFLLEADKIYEVTGKLGVITASGDTDSPIIETRTVGKYSNKEVEKVLDSFRGKISQMPSMYSAIKFKGEPLYKLARQGIEIERQPRDINIFELTLLNLSNDQIKLRVHCSKGTYIRTLIADIGEKLGCGAHAIELRRLSVGCFQESQMISFNTILEMHAQKSLDKMDALLLPIESMLGSWESIQLSENLVYYLRQGNPIVVPSAPTSGWVILKRKSGEFIGVGEIADDGKVAPRRLL